MGFDIFGYIELIIGVYVLYCAVTGKGKLYKNDNIKKGQENAYKKQMRIIAWPTGIFVFFVGLFDIIKTRSLVSGGWANTLFWIFFILSLISIGVMLFISVKLTDRQAQNNKQGDKKTKSEFQSAFDFQDDKIND